LSQENGLELSAKRTFAFVYELEKMQTVARRTFSSHD